MDIKISVMKKNIKFEVLEKQELVNVNGGSLPPWSLSETAKWFIDGMSRYWMRKAYDKDYQEADFMIYKM